MIETLILILKAVGLICVISLTVGITLFFLIRMVLAIIDDIRHSDGWYF